MSLERELSAAIHGSPVGQNIGDVVCDLPHEPPRPVDPTRRVQYECIRLDDSVTAYEGVRDAWYGEWAPDLLRCPDCEIAALEAPTDGFDEALVEVAIAQADGVYTIDAQDLRVLDYSPADAGQDPPPVPGSIFRASLQQQDAGALRRSRLSRQVEWLRQQGADELAQTIEDGLAGEL